MTILGPVLGGAMGQAGAAGIQTGADPGVLTNTFDVQAYATAAGWGTIPAETGPTQEPIADQGAVGDGVADDTAEVQAALAALPGTGGVLDLSQGIFGVSGTADILLVGSKQNITIKGGGWSDGVAQTSGLKVLSFTTSTDPNHAVIRYDPPANDGLNFVVRDIEIDSNDTFVIGINTQSDTNTWIINNYIHDIGVRATGGARAAIAGIDDQTDVRIIGNLVRRTAGRVGTGSPPNEGVRGIWSGFFDVSGMVYAHNIVTDTAHSGIILHQSDFPASNVEFNTVLRPGLDIGGAGIKCEFDTTENSATFDVPGIIATYRRNYIDVDFTTFGGGPSAWCIQIETTNVDIRENILVDSLRSLASFTRCRKVTIEDNVCTEISEYGTHTDAGINPGQDRTGLIYRNNSFSDNGKPMEVGVRFGLSFTGSIFGFNDPIEVVDNKIVGASVIDVETTTDLDNYVNFTQSNNGPAAPGARNTLLPPSYV